MPSGHCRVAIQRDRTLNNRAGSRGVVPPDEVADIVTEHRF